MKWRCCQDTLGRFETALMRGMHVPVDLPAECALCVAWIDAKRKCQGDAQPGAPTPTPVEVAVWALTNLPADHPYRQAVEKGGPL